MHFYDFLAAATTASAELTTASPGGLSDGEIAAIVICSVVGGAALIGSAAYCIIKGRRVK
jgi:hypothetical protein